MSFDQLKWSVLERFSQITRLADTFTNKVNTEATEIINEKINLFKTKVLGHYSAQSNGTNCDIDEPAKLYLSRWAASIVNNTDHEPDYQQINKASVNVDDCFELLEEVFDSWFEDGQLNRRMDYVLEYIFSGGVHKNCKKDVWPYLLKFYDWEDTKQLRQKKQRNKTKEYNNLVNLVKTNLDEETKREAFKITKDVLRTDRQVEFYSENVESCEIDEDAVGFGLPGASKQTDNLKEILLCYYIFNKNFGYVQGMSDLLSPILFVVRDNATAFWCFVEFMEKMKHNFSKDQVSMHEQLVVLNKLVKLMIPKLHEHLAAIESLNMFFAYRWLLLWFKREFEFSDTVNIYELLITDYCTSKMFYFVALAILDMHQFVIIKYIDSLDSMLKYINELSGNMDYIKVFKRAEYLFYSFRIKIYTVSLPSNKNGTKIVDLPNTQDLSTLNIPLELKSLSILLDQPYRE